MSAETFTVQWARGADVNRTAQAKIRKALDVEMRPHKVRKPNPREVTCKRCLGTRPDGR